MSFELTHSILLSREALLRIVFEECWHKRLRLRLRKSVVVPREVGLVDAFQHLPSMKPPYNVAPIAGSEGSLAGQKLEEEDAKAPPIGNASVTSQGDHLWCKIRR